MFENALEIKAGLPRITFCSSCRQLKTTFSWVSVYNITIVDQLFVRPYLWWYEWRYSILLAEDSFGREVFWSKITPGFQPSWISVTKYSNLYRLKRIQTYLQDVTKTHEISGLICMSMIIINHDATKSFFFCFFLFRYNENRKTKYNLHSISQKEKKKKKKEANNGTIFNVHFFKTEEEKNQRKEKK